MAEPFEGIRRLRIDWCVLEREWRFTLTALCGSCQVRGGAVAVKPAAPSGELGLTIAEAEAELLAAAGFAVARTEDVTVVRCLPCRDGTRLTDLG